MSDNPETELEHAPEWLTPKEAAAYMGVTSGTIYSWIGRNMLEITRDKRTVRINRSSLEIIQQRKNVRKVIGQVIEEIAPQGNLQQKREVTGAVFVTLAGLQTERQQFVQQINELQSKVTQDAYTLGQLEEKTLLIEELEEIITYMRSEVTRLQETNKRLINTSSILAIVLILLAFMSLVCVIILLR